MDQFTRRYIYLLSAVTLAGLLFWLLNADSRVGELNGLLEADEQLASYPYQFRVISLDEGVAEMSSPRSARMSAIRGLRIMFPYLLDKSAVSPEMVEAQERLATLQSRAAALIQSQEDVRSVRWTLDEQWFSRHGVYLE
jgi:hypothetical protein